MDPHTFVLLQIFVECLDIVEVAEHEGRGGGDGAGSLLQLVTELWTVLYRLSD